MGWERYRPVPYDWNSTSKEALYLIYTDLFLHFFNTHGSIIIGYAVVASQSCSFFSFSLICDYKVRRRLIKQNKINKQHLKKQC